MPSFALILFLRLPFGRLCLRPSVVASARLERAHGNRRRARRDPWQPDGRRGPSATRPGERGQATVEYALVILGAATIALLLVAWAAHTGRIGALLDHMMDVVSDRAG
jgi:hypothetical protein